MFLWMGAVLKFLTAAGPDSDCVGSRLQELGDVVGAVEDLHAAHALESHFKLEVVEMEWMLRERASRRQRGGTERL